MFPRRAPRRTVIPPIPASWLQAARAATLAHNGRQPAGIPESPPGFTAWTGPCYRLAATSGGPIEPVSDNVADPPASASLSTSPPNFAHAVERYFDASTTTAGESAASSIAATAGDGDSQSLPESPILVVESPTTTVIESPPPPLSPTTFDTFHIKLLACSNDLTAMLQSVPERKFTEVLRDNIRTQLGMTGDMLANLDKANKGEIWLDEVGFGEAIASIYREVVDLEAVVKEISSKRRRT